MRAFLNLTWLEIKIFVREPLGVLGTVVIPVAMFVLLGRSFGSAAMRSERAAYFLGEGLPIFAALFIAIGAALSLVAIISIYREGGILKRLRATPLRPSIILGAHVAVKLVFSLLTLGLMMLAGRRFYPVGLEVHVVSFACALVVGTLAVLTMGFVIASLVPTARFAQPIGSIIFYPMLAISGILAPVDAMSPAWAAIGRVLPLTHAVTLMRAAWKGESWWTQLPELGILALTIAICIAVSSRIFRWE